MATNSNNMQKADELIKSINDKKKNVKIIKKEQGLLEREEVEEKVILSEDNRQVLFG